MIQENDSPTVLVHFERPIDGGFDSARCKLPTYEWIMRDGYTDEEIKKFECMLHNTEKSFFKYAEMGGLDIARTDYKYIAQGQETLKQKYYIKLEWDSEAAVWMATSDDVPGLVLESGSCDALIERVRYAVSNLLGMDDVKGNEKIILHFTAEREDNVYI